MDNMDKLADNLIKNIKLNTIQYPITVEKITFSEPYSLYKQGGLAKVRPCGDEYEDKTYLGFFLGELPTSSIARFSPNTGELTVGTVGNPAIFVPALNKIIYGYESWWSRIESEDDLKDISDSDIQNQWYVKAFRDFMRKDKNNNGSNNEMQKDKP